MDELGVWTVNSQINGSNLTNGKKLQKNHGYVDKYILSKKIKSSNLNMLPISSRIDPFFKMVFYF